MKLVKIFLLCVCLLGISCNIAQGQLEGDGDGLFATIETNKGAIVIQLEFENTPVTVANFVSLAEGTNTMVAEEFSGKHYYDGLTFHRVVPNFVIQGGDPTGSGSGDPGYKFFDEFPKKEGDTLLLTHDRKGILSMANSGKNTNGSQFFITHKETPHLDGKHTVFGHVVSGLEVVDLIKKGDVMEKVTITSKGKKAKRFKAAKVFETAFKQMEAKEKAKQERLQKNISEMKGIVDSKLMKVSPLASGLRILTVEEGTGVKPKYSDNIKVSYAGYFESGKLFDTNIKEIAERFDMYDARRDANNGYTPFQTVYNNKARLIAGFKEALQQMKVGDKALVYIPYELGYGKAGNRGIPPKSNLVFHLEITEIIK